MLMGILYHSRSFFATKSWKLFSILQKYHLSSLQCPYSDVSCETYGVFFTFSGQRIVKIVLFMFHVKRGGEFHGKMIVSRETSGAKNQMERKKSRSKCHQRKIKQQKNMASSRGRCHIIERGKIRREIVRCSRRTTDRRSHNSLPRRTNRSGRSGRRSP